MKIEPLLNELFPAGHSVSVRAGLLSGYGSAGPGQVAVLGTTDHLAVSAEVALELACFVLNVVREKPGVAILMLVDTQGQKLSKADELLGLNGYLAHLVKCLDLASRRGHRLITLVYDEAVSGGFLSFGLMADDIHALADAQIRVMNLPAMARITKLPLETLQELSVKSPSFAPGVDNFYKLGGVLSIWRPPLADHLEAALKRQTCGDHRRDDGMERMGRKLAARVSRLVVDAKPKTG